MSNNIYPSELPPNKARQIHTDTTNFTGNLSTADTDIQKSLDTIDNLTINNESTTVSDTTTINLTLTGSNVTADGLYTAGDALTLTGADIDFDGGTTPGGELGGTWASPTIDDSLAVSSWNLTTPTLTTSATVTDAFTLGLGSGKGLIQFDDEATDFISFSNCNVGIGEVAPAYTTEITDNSATPTFGMSDDDITHGVTTLASTDTFAHLTSISSTVGGLQVTGLADATGIALGLKGVQSSDPTDTTPAISLIGTKASGTGVQDLASTETVFQVGNNDNSTKGITVLGSDNVGINDTTPGARLTVTGTAGTTPLSISDQSYVNLASYEEGDAYVKGNLVNASSSIFTSLIPTTITAMQGINIDGADNLQYTRGSLLGGDGSGVVYENFDPHQGTLEFWVRPNWNGDDGISHRIFETGVSATNNLIRLVKSTDSHLYFTIWDKDSTEHNVAYNVSSVWTAGNWYHIIATWDFKNNAMVLYESGTLRDDTGHGLSSDSINNVASTLQIGQGISQTYQFNGVISGRILNRPLTSTEVTALYASGAGHTDTFTVTPDTVWLGTYSDSDDDAVFWHRGQVVSSISTVTLTLGSAIGLRSWKNGDRVVVYDDATTPNVVQTTINSTPSGSTIVVTDSCAAVTGTNKWISKNLIVDPGMEHANANAYTAGDGQSTLAKDATVVKFDTDSLKITNGDATQAFARQTITTVAGEDYRFHGWFRSPATPNGASQLVDVDGTAALGITVTQAGATTAATWYEIDFTFEAADTSTTIDLGSGSVTNAEIGYWDNVSVRKNLVNDGGIEDYTGTQDDGTSDTFNKWDGDGGQIPSGSKIEATATKHSGNNAVKIYYGGTGNLRIFQTVNISASTWYTISYWGKTDASGRIRSPIVSSPNYLQDDGLTWSAINNYVDALEIGNNVSSYTKKSFTFKTPVGASTINIYLGYPDNSGTSYIDDISLVELDQAGPTTAKVAAATYPYGYVGIGTASPENLLEIQGAENLDAVLVLDADDGDDNADTWTIESEAATNNLTFNNHTTEIATLSSGGNLQIDGDLDIDGNDIDLGDAGGFSGLKFVPATTTLDVYIDGVKIGHFSTDGTYTDDVP